MSGVWDELKRRNVVRVAIAYAIVSWLVLQLTDVLMSLLGLPDWVGKFILLLIVVGFFLALILSWAYELTPDGLKKEKDIDRSRSVARGKGRRLDLAIIALLAVTSSYFAIDKFVLDSDSVEEGDAAVARPAHKSIAVLPFVPMSSGENDGYFADGLTEEILNALAQLPELQVTARTSSFFFKGQNIPVPDIAARLDVVNVVEGSVRRDKDRVRITAQLIRAADGFHLWSQTYDRTLEDIFAVQEDIAENIAEALGVVLDDDARQVMRDVGIRDVEAFIAYQKGRELYARAHQSGGSISEALAVANEYLDQALEAYPGLTVARLLKTDRAGHIIREIAVGERDEEYPGEAQETLAALRKDYDLAWQLSPPGDQRDILDLEKTLLSDDWSGLPARFHKALQPGGCPQINWTNTFLNPYGWARQLVEKSREKLRCDPMDFIASSHLPIQLIYSGDPEAALLAVEHAESRGLTHQWLRDGRYWALLASGRADDSAASGVWQEGSILRYDRQILRAALAGDIALARKMVEDYWSGPDADDANSLLVAAVVGDRERANTFASRIDIHPGGVIALAQVVTYCFCGAPFDLEAAPNFKARIEEAGFSWPPQTIIHYPSKTW